MVRLQLSAIALAALLRGAAVTAIDLDLDIGTGLDKEQKLPRPAEPSCSTTTITIPYVGTTTTSTTITPCAGDVTVVIETPLVTSTCGPITYPEPTPGGPCPAIKRFCRASGLNVDYYANPFAGYSRGPASGLNSSYYFTQGLKPLKSALTNLTFFPQDNGPGAGMKLVYPRPDLPGFYYAIGWTKETNGGIVVDANNFTLVYEGFYRAPTTGKYQLCTMADNENDVFFGHGNAFSCLTGNPDPAAKPVTLSTGGNFINGINCTDVNLIGGAYYPVRNVMGDWQGPSAFNFTIQKPGEAFEDRKNLFTGDAFPRSCGFFV